ncbi:hypothetical protein B0I35DRAFT_59363 [Stachybotrys elegans]|uniref:Rhodopsin domain-containing protein n=1 Tax=Stachybotrys elegans TaxID=80388 RepID=A0A8K0SK94_9HYPO|nr:hypothetical protein B0I35DRAFT_59363 [Stachybotrys elegans]
MPIGGAGPSSVAAMWSLTTVTLIFVLLRMYTRYFYIHSIGIDDHVYNFAFLLLLMYTIFITISATYGFGQSMANIEDPQDMVNAVFFEAIGQLFAVTGMAVAKWSLGLFLLRIVTLTWHKVIIWGVMTTLMGASISVCFVFMLQCTPPAYLWDRRIPGGFCHIDSTPVSFLLCISCVVADFFFALFPWIFIWGLQMNQREKVVILVSMSLGVLAGACGIWRTLEVPQLSSPDYLRDTVGLIVWSAAEIAVTMICISIPVCRPLYKKYIDKLTSTGGSKGHDNPPSHDMPLRTFGGSTMHRLPEEASGPGYNIANSTHKLGSSSKTYALARAAKEPNSSDEEILGPEYRHLRGKQTEEGNGIYVTQEYRVSST